MRRKIMVLLMLFIALILSGCTETVTDTVTVDKIKVIENPDPSLKKVKVRTDGMLSEVGYSHPHPFGMGNEVLVDLKYYEQHDISRGDIVVFKTKNKKEQDTDIARVVGLPGETVRIKKGQVYINDNKLDVFYGNDSTSDNSDSWNAVALKENEYFILADVRWRGFNDSQTAGAFLKQDVLGKVVGYEKPGINQK
ncbi:signal peptidase I [Paenibacillus sp. sptzw28]|uniref:signal peptidase I n=1 Tax=Paenibacillus sp. sptzw28 TaxID=715179 RepID=UPI001C6DD5CF|nr:signal peptidase I [Paenibacillus sp. sptzw28]QYR19133.1 signal peptidase I [Paenibacillus sp. sptzw28]